MTYVIPLIVVLVLVAGFVTFLVLNATRRGRSASSGGEQGPPGIGQDETPLGDTAEHAGTQADSGRTVGRADAGEAGGTGEPVHSGYEGTSAAGAGPGAAGGGAPRRPPGGGGGAGALRLPRGRPAGGAARGAGAAVRRGGAR